MDLDDLDRAILHLLQVDARNNTNTEIADRLDVAASTVGNRINEMESNGIIRGYSPTVDYEKAGLPLYALFVCTAPVSERHHLANEALKRYGVVDVRETIAGEDNVHIETVSRDIGELEGVTQEFDSLGLAVNRAEILQRHRTQPFDQFGSELFET